LERRLQEKLPDRQVEVINFGVAGYGTDQELLLFEKQGRLYQPDAVVVFFYANDLWNNTADKGIGAERGYKPFFRVGRDGGLHLAGVPVKKTRYWDESWLAAQPWHRRLGRYGHQHWHLYVLLEKALADPEVSPGQRQQFYEGLYGRDVAGRWRPLWDLTGRILQAFKETVARTGAEMLLVYAPAIVQIEEENWRTKRELHGLVGEFDRRKPSRELARLAAQHDIPFVDLSGPFAEAAEEQRLYFRDSHWNERGHALAAQVVGDYLLQRNVGNPGARRD